MVTSVVIVDDNLDFLDSAAAMLSDFGFAVLACVHDVERAVAVVTELVPAVVLVDIQLPGRSGIDLAHEIALVRPRPAVILISSRGAETYGRLLRDAPVRGFISKKDLSGETLATFL